MKLRTFILGVVFFNLSFISLPAFSQSEKVPSAKVLALASGQSQLVHLSSKTVLEGWQYNEKGEKTSTGSTTLGDSMKVSEPPLCEGETFLRVSLSYPGVIFFPAEELLSLLGTVEIAGTAAVIPEKAHVKIYQGLRLGFNTKDVHYDFPMNLARQNNTQPAHLFLQGMLSILPLKKPEKAVAGCQAYLPFIEMSVSHLSIGENGLLRLGADSEEASKGWFSRKSTIILYDSFIQTPLFDSEEDTLKVIGNVTLAVGKEHPSRLKGRVSLEAQDSFHASEWANETNTTHLMIKGNTDVSGTTFTYAIGYDTKTPYVTLPHVTFTESVDLSNVQISISGFFYKGIVQAIKGKKWPIMKCYKEMTGLPKLPEIELKDSPEIEELKNSKATLEKSKDESTGLTTLYIVFS